MNAVQLPLAPHNGTATSRIAASMVKVGHQETMVLSCLRAGGLTQDELSARTGLLRSAVAGRCNTLEHKGLIFKDGTRLTRYGRPAYVYHLTATAGGSSTAPAAAEVSSAAYESAATGSAPVTALTEGNTRCS